MLIFMTLVVLYFVIPLTRGKQTVGCFVMRIRMPPPSRAPCITPRKMDRPAFPTPILLTTSVKGRKNRVLEFSVTALWALADFTGRQV